ncbi:hypothetical protein BVRB_5g111420 isoform A [Beta vulgaris subsp. vulgaris]|nr:hypothetical protein BVRB_5g111420 isoform A [Beta vulgaris subsp. vulgaris]
MQRNNEQSQKERTREITGKSKKPQFLSFHSPILSLTQIVGAAKLLALLLGLTRSLSLLSPAGLLSFFLSFCRYCPGSFTIAAVFSLSSAFTVLLPLPCCYRRRSAGVGGVAAANIGELLRGDYGA